MASEDISDRTLPPSERRRREARARGQIARSGEFTSAIVLLCGCGLIGYLATSFVEWATQSLKNSLTTTSIAPLTAGTASELVRGAIGASTFLVLPLLIGIGVCGVLANLIQSGWLWAPLVKLPTLRLSSVISGTKTYEAFGRILRMSIIATLTWTCWSASRCKIHSLSSGEASDLITSAGALAAELCLPLMICVLVFALIDYGMRYWKNERDLMMTVEEQRREQREDAVNPAVKQRRRRDL